jgi:hypothetical protein
MAMMDRLRGVPASRMHLIDDAQKAASLATMLHTEGERARE